MNEKVEVSVKIVGVYIRLKIKFIKKKRITCTVHELVLTLELINGIGLDNLLLPGGKARMRTSLGKRLS